MEPVMMETTNSMGAKPFRLTSRDKNILCALEKYRELTAIEIETLFWRGKGNWNHVKRLAKLESRGLIQIHQTSRHVQKTYSLSKQGHNTLRKNMLALFEQKPPRSQFQSPVHDEIVRSIARQFESNSRVLGVQLDHELRKTLINASIPSRRALFSVQVPDALVQFDLPQSAPIQMALEVELVLKSRKRYLGIFQNHSKAKYDAFLYVFDTPAKLTRFLSTVSYLRREKPLIAVFFQYRKVACTLIDDLKSKGLSAPVTPANAFERVTSFAQWLNEADRP